MGGGLVQLAFVGSQDVYLTGHPQVSFFKVMYRRHTPFSMESIEHNVTGDAAPGSRVSYVIEKNGDLISTMWLEVTLVPETSGNIRYVNSIGHALIEYVELEIGGQRVDLHTGEWLDVWSQLTTPESKWRGLKHMIGRRTLAESEPLATHKLRIPLQFFFCTHPGLALPLVALGQTTVKVHVKFRDASQLTNTNPSVRNDQGVSLVDRVTSFQRVRLFATHIYVDKEEQRRFARTRHEYLISQVQCTGPMRLDENDRTQLILQHPVKELVWVVRKSNHACLEYGGATEFNMTLGRSDSFWFDTPIADEAFDTFDTGKLQFNGHDRFEERDASYFRLVQPYERHTRIPTKHIYNYSFALNPEAHQPSGSCNFTKVHQASIQLSGASARTGGNGVLVLFAVSVNVLRVNSGMCSLVY